MVSIPVTLKVYNDSPQGWRGREKRGNFKRSVVRIQSLGSEISTLLSWFRRFYLTTKRCDSHYEIPYDPVVRTSDRDHYSKQGAALLEANMIRPDASHHAAPASPHPPSLRPPGAVKQKGARWSREEVRRRAVRGAGARTTILPRRLTDLMVHSASLEVAWSWRAAARASCARA